MTPTLSGILNALGGAEIIEVAGCAERNGVVTARLAETESGESAMLVCNAAQPPVAVSKRGAKSYGAYVIIGERYGDWIKGDDADECAAYVMAWFLGRVSRR